MRKGLVCIFVAAAVIFSLGTMTVSAACRGGRGCHTDVDGNGTCDNYENGDCMGNSCYGYLDENGDGICDNREYCYDEHGRCVGNYKNCSEVYGDCVENYKNCGKNHGICARSGENYSEIYGGCLGSFSGFLCGKFNRHTGNSSRVGSNYGGTADSYDNAGSCYDSAENCRGDASGDDCYVTERHNGHGRGKHGCGR